MSSLLQSGKKYTFLWDKASKRPACVLLQALYGGNREVCFVFPDWELAPTKTMVKMITEETAERESLTARRRSRAAKALAQAGDLDRDILAPKKRKTR